MKRLAFLVSTLLCLAMSTAGYAGAVSTHTTATLPYKISVSLSDFAPQIITASSKFITVAGEITNTGDRVLDDIQLRLQLGEQLTTDAKLTKALTTPPDVYSTVSSYLNIIKTLEPGKKASFHVTVPINGAGGLPITHTGVYPLLVNFNGIPGFGDQARLAAINTLLPVQSTSKTASSPGKSVPALTMLWPVVDSQPNQFGISTDGKALLSNDDLATSLAAGGQLYNMVNSVRQAMSSNGTLATSICFAIDPDLLSTVSAMTTGYEVRAGDNTTAGTGSGAAASWLTLLKDATRGKCVISLPYADADLVALSSDSTAAALVKPAVSDNTVAQTLPNAAVQAGVTWPTDNAIDQSTEKMIANAGTKTVILGPGSVSNAKNATHVTVSGSKTDALLTDSLITTALAEQPEVVSTQGNPNQELPTLSTQNALAALYFRTHVATTSGSLLIAPPHDWSPTSAELTTWLNTLTSFYKEKSATATSLATSLVDPISNTVSLQYSQSDAKKQLPSTVIAQISSDYAEQGDLLSAMSRDDTKRVEPQTLVAPIQVSLLRSSSSAWRGLSADQQLVPLQQVTAALDQITSKVTVSNPGRPISLGSSDAPITFFVTNSLPVNIQVRAHFALTAGFSATAPDTLIPANSNRSIFVQSHVQRSGRFTVDISLQTPGGSELGHTTRLELSSSVVGKVTKILTIVAFAMLVLLSGRRIIRRITAGKAGPRSGGAAEDAPDPEQERIES